MLVNCDETCKGVTGFKDSEIREMKAYLQGAVYCWCQNRQKDWFSARDFLGGDNFYWQGTPMYRLFEYYYADGKNSDYAVEEAGKAAGRLLKIVLDEDKRSFETNKGYVREYRWTGE